MITIEITNWKELCVHFGLNDSEQLRGAKNIHRLMYKQSLVYIIAVSCLIKGESIALFEHTKTVGQTYYYEFTGTAN